MLELENILCNAAVRSGRAIPWQTFERLCKQKVRNLGFDIQQTQRSRDDGVDIFATDTAIFRQHLTYVFSCKRFEGSVGVEYVRELHSVVVHFQADQGILITTGKCTKDTHNWTQGKPLQIIEGYDARTLVRHMASPNT